VVTIDNLVMGGSSYQGHLWLRVPAQKGDKTAKQYKEGAQETLVAKIAAAKLTAGQVLEDEERNRGSNEFRKSFPNSQLVDYNSVTKPQNKKPMVQLKREQAFSAFVRPRKRERGGEEVRLFVASLSMQQRKEIQDELSAWSGDRRTAAAVSVNADGNKKSKKGTTTEERRTAPPPSKSGRRQAPPPSKGGRRQAPPPSKGGRGQR
jgi:hypothetical protein